MDSNFTLYIYSLIAVIVAFFVIKKVASCLIKTIILLAIIAVAYYLFFK